MLGELLNIGPGSAVASLSEMAHEEVVFFVPRAGFLPRARVVEDFEAKLLNQLSAVRQDLAGSFVGRALLVFAQDEILGLV